MVRHQTVCVKEEGQLALLNSQQCEKLLVIRRRVEDLPTIIAPRNYVIQTALDFDARFPWHKAADASPLPAFRQTALTARILTSK